MSQSFVLQMQTKQTSGFFVSIQDQVCFVYQEDPYCLEELLHI